MMSDYQRPHNTVLVPCDKLKAMQDYIKHLESALESSLGMSKALVGREQKEWQYLTDEEIKEIIGSYGNEGGIGGYTRELFDKIEAKIKEKNVQKT
jgi:hypothetical protein